jgi:excisionase family DNA binding protein
MPVEITKPPPLLIDRAETAALLSVCPRTVDALAKARELEAVRIGRRVLFDRRDIEAFIQRRKGCAA